MSHAIARRPVAQRLREWLIARCLAPINLDGSQVSEVTIDGQSVRAVTMDGDEVFGAIPDSVIFQHSGDTFTTGDSTWADDVASNDMTITGDPQASTMSDGVASVVGDGTDDDGAVTLPSVFQGSSLTQFSIEVAIQYTSNDNGCVCGLRPSGSNQFFNLQVDEDHNGDADNGNIAFILRDQDNNGLRFAPTTNLGLDDGTRHDVSVVVNDATTNDGEMIIDGSNVSLSFGEQQNPDNFGSWGADMRFFVRNLDGSLDSYYNGHIGINRWHDSAISQQTISDY